MTTFAEVQDSLSLAEYKLEIEMGSNALTIDPAELLTRNSFERVTAGSNFETLIKAFEFIKGIPRKGMLITGNVGTGKTLAIKSLFPFANVVNLTDVCDLEYLTPKKDDEGREYWKLGHKHIILDDIGNEQIRNVYGVKYDTVANYLLQWHVDKFQDVTNENRLFLTTNLDIAQLNDRYGVRIMDRLLEMCVYVKFYGESRRVKPVIFG